jgi:hypothetical protein
MMYLWPGSQSLADQSACFGVMTAAAHQCVPQGIREGRPWACDNEAYTRGVDLERLRAHLARLRPWRSTCLFVVAPDVVGDARATLASWTRYAGELPGWPLAFAAQDGQESCGWPVHDVAALFIGGTTAWKLSAAADDCIRIGQRRGLWLHVGRVNSVKRWRHFDQIGVDSVDGTFPCFEPDTARRRLAGAALQSPLRGLLPGGDCTR